MNDLQKLQEWRRGGDARVLVTCHDASIRLINWDNGYRSEADFVSAADAVQALDENRVHWTTRGRIAAAVRSEPMGARTATGRPPRTLSENPRTARARERRTQREAAEVTALAGVRDDWL